ncbi:sensor histidine kinase [Streptomyces sp. B1866]|uniref:sensor histidine kinase n=1 Tax=Streptomyces sp. B1866 TaxID=3075431 RepID=UPI00288D1399|nr:sensor histidine kinase [Streptomyces sp. B1866]MDT3398944.1 sensor histidine kinase [Streptomyces sp. B1866]
MPADLPLEEPRRRLTGRPGPREPGVAHPVYARWDGYFAVVFVVTMAFVAAASDPGRGPRAVALALFAATAPWYWCVGRRLVRTEGTDERRSAVYVAVAVLLFLVPSAIVGETRIATFALVPQCFMLLRMRWALAAAAVVNVAPVVAWALVEPRPTGDLFSSFLFALVSLAFSVVFGNWIILVVEQSRERAVLIAELESSREDVARLSAAHGALAERERLSREIHDTLAQGFTSLLMLVQAVQSEFERDPALAHRHLDLMARTARENLADARALVAGSAPADLDGGSLPDAVGRLAERHREQAGAPASLEVSGQVRALPPALEVVALRACQEALANVRRHAGPGAAVEIALAYGPDALRVAVRDTGRGFDPAAAHGGYGLAGLRARTAEVGGTAEVASGPGRGTAVTVTLPVRSPAQVRSAS